MRTPESRIRNIRVVFGTFVSLMLKKAQKKQLVNDLTRELETAKGLVLSDFQGLPDADIQKLRMELRKQGVKHKVVKLTLLQRVFRRLGVDTAKFDYHVPMAVSYSSEDEILPARLIKAFARTHDKLKIMGGLMDRRLLDGAAMTQLASLPGKQELRGQLANVIASPLRGLVSVLAGNIRGLINVLNAKSKL